ncbi:MAG: hypothetical protein IPG45_11525 [Deltaproteobacteria bacterium]|jgi:L-alanine-DL-glutamate epimerase-like enolase superfamily enzyme|nr:hypothetical protein [Deltaproteobacteria bacterium]
MIRLTTATEPFLRPVQAEDARRRWSERRGLIFTVQDGAGGRGRGEAAPLPGYSIESLAEVEGALLGAELEVDPERDLAGVWAAVPSTWPASARFAAESALLEWWAGRRGTSLERALGAGQGPLPVAHLVTELDLERALLLIPGAAALKIKIGRPGRLEEELQLIHALSQATHLPLRVDANQAFHEETPAVLAALAELGVELVEEPCPDTLALTGSPVPLALDESLFEHGPSRAELAERPFIKALVLKPTCLGLAQTLSLAWRGPAPIISHTYEGPIGQRVLHALARSLSSPYAHGVGPYRREEPS